MLIYIHGANATPNSFNFLRPLLGEGIALSYDSRMGFKTNLERLHQEISEYDDITFIAHSLGGVYALHLANLMADRVKQGISMSTPYGGHPVAVLARMLLPFEQLLHDIVPHSWAMRELERINLKWPWCNLVTVKGHVPWLHLPNDGVVTIESQRHRTDMQLIEVEMNHYEVVVSSVAADIIASKINQPK